MNLIYVVKGGIIGKIANVVIPVVVSSYTQQQAVAFSKLFFPSMSKILKSIIQYHTLLITITRQNWFKKLFYT